MQKLSYKIINGITIYRIVAAPVLLLMIFMKNIDWFKWLLALSFFTDLIDGYLARRYKVTSVLGAKLDSIGDGLTIVVAVIGVFVFRFDFVKDHVLIVVILLMLFVFQNSIAFFRYHQITSFHTYLAKAAALLQGTFLIFIFLFPQPVYVLFYVAAVVTAIELTEEIVLVFVLPEWKTNVKGLYWVIKGKNRT